MKVALNDSLVVIHKRTLEHISTPQHLSTYIRVQWKWFLAEWNKQTNNAKHIHICMCREFQACDIYEREYIVIGEFIFYFFFK